MYYISLILCSCIIGCFSKLTPHNYATRKEHVKEPLVEKGLWCYVIGATKKPPTNADEAQKEDW